ncbi:hypothetical protein MiSe_16240 [Microseira wollei NIES-4236]|uniref:Uncharacterized protein n=1 Tax=Microseira wollei NIES-4236 TaxID=2530354 RepID=A0AAV3X277_9CYAN|nr:hypothetical protein MiSe_16240 [Microseira wollei NIES-4236]
MVELPIFPQGLCKAWVKLALALPNPATYGISLKYTSKIYYFL